MRTKHQKIIAVMVLATALAADRAALAAPTIRPQLAQTARRVADRLTQSFRHVVQATRMPELRQSQPALVIPVARPAHQVRLHQTHEGLFRFRLPPPLR